MTAHQSNAFLLSATLHGAAAALVLLATFGLSHRTKEPEKVFDLVAGVGDNFSATMAPAGTGRPATQRTMAQQLRRQLIVAESKAKQEAAKERADEAKRQAQLEAEQKAAAKADPKTAAKSTATVAKADSPKIKHIDEDFSNGVPGGSKSVKEGAGGNALVRSDGTEMEAYFAMLKSRLLEAIDKPEGVSDTLVAEVEFRLNADGSLASYRITKKSGSPEFDRAVLAAFSHTRMPARPDGHGETLTLAFRTRDTATH